jgi:uroporphyrinogen III methyltransferase/synthase
MTAGKVFLVGAGPGDPGLITLKGMESLKQADVIVYDHLLDEWLLNLASAKAEKIYAGKIGNKHAKEQDEINRLLVEKALEGKIVVRLKGGDPFVLGRGGEEAEALRINLIPFEIVPGITSAIAVPAYAGIPVTHRGLASSFAVITGHEDPGKADSSLDWEKISTGIDTLIFLMGMENLDQIATNLIKHGRSPETPAAVIKQGTQPDQRVIVASLKDIGAKVKEQKLGPPAVIVVGEVVRLRENINWFDNRPLFGKRILITRARHQAGALSRLLAELGAKPIELPVIDIMDLTDNTELDSAVSDLNKYNWIIFTSANGVEAFFKRLHSHKLDARELKGLKIGVIGQATSQVLEQQGIIPDFLPGVFTTQGLLTGLKNIQISGQRFLLPRADIADKELSAGLIEMGAQVQDIAVYKTGPELGTAAQIIKLFRSGEIDIVTFTSSSTVSNLMTALENSNVSLNGMKVACIGPKTAETAVKAGLKVDILAEQQTVQGLVEAIEKYFKKETI